jgi:hypothetical protein
VLRNGDQKQFSRRGSESMQLMYLLAIAAGTSIEHSYSG